MKRRTGPARPFTPFAAAAPTAEQMFRSVVGANVTGRGRYGPGGGRRIRHWRQDLSGTLLPALDTKETKLDARATSDSLPLIGTHSTNPLGAKGLLW